MQIHINIPTEHEEAVLDAFADAEGRDAGAVERALTQMLASVVIDRQITNMRRSNRSAEEAEVASVADAFGVTPPGRGPGGGGIPGRPPGRGR